MAEHKAFKSMMKGLEESLEYAKGDKSKARKMSVTVAELPSYRDKEIKRIREDLNLTQRNFAFVLGVSQKTVEAWECGRIHPTGPAYRLIGLLHAKGVEDFSFVSVSSS